MPDPSPMRDTVTPPAPVVRPPAPGMTHIAAALPPIPGGPQPRPTPTRPLARLTVLLVDDSRYSSDAMRLMCLRSGARIRRADSLMAAARHLGTFRPDVLVIDLGLPDGSGLDLIAETAMAPRPRPMLLGLSGYPDAKGAVMAAGADGFLAKPLSSLANFQETVLAHLPLSRHPNGPRTINEETIQPDPLAYHDDLRHIADLLDAPATKHPERLRYLIQFMDTLARSRDDAQLAAAATALRTALNRGCAPGAPRAHLAALLHQRLHKGQRPKPQL